MYTHPRLVVIEHLLMGLFLAVNQVEADIRLLLAALRERRGNNEKQVMQCEGLLYLCTEYCPALVEMGTMVRQCFWKTQDVRSGAVARQVIRDAIAILHALRTRGPTEYVRNLVVMDLLWDCSGLHDALPAAVMVEECLESSLSVLTRRQGTDTRAHTVTDVSD